MKPTFNGSFSRTERGIVAAMGCGALLLILAVKVAFFAGVLWLGVSVLRWLGVPI